MDTLNLIKPVSVFTHNIKEKKTLNFISLLLQELLCDEALVEMSFFAPYWQ